MKLKFAALLCGVMMAAATTAVASSAGGYAGFEQRMGPGGAALARGNTGVADPSASPAAFWNPGAAATLRVYSLALAGEWRSLERRGGSLGASAPIGNRAMISYAALWRGAGSILWIDEEDQNAGTLSPSWSSHYVSLGWRLSRTMGWGITGQWRHWNTDIDGSSWSSPISLGVSWYREWNSRFSTGVVLRDLGIASGGIARFRQESPGDDSHSSDDFYPRTVVVGSRYSTELLGWPFRLLLDVVDLQLSDRGWAGWSDHELQGRCGFEWELLGDGRLRGGWDDGNWSLGVGWQLQSKTTASRQIGVDSSRDNSEVSTAPSKMGGWKLELEYQLLWERSSTFFNPLGFAVRWLF